MLFKNNVELMVSVVTKSPDMYCTYPVLDKVCKHYRKVYGLNYQYAEVKMNVQVIVNGGQLFQVTTVRYLLLRL